MKKKNRESFKDYVNQLKPLKILEMDTKLPKIFDTMWDAKIGGDLFLWKLNTNPIVLRFLAEHGYDVEAFKKIQS